MINGLIDKAYAVAVSVCPDGIQKDNCGDYSWGPYILALYGFLVKAGGILVVGMIAYAALTYITSKGESTKLEAAKDKVLGAITGYILLLMIGVLLKFLGIEAP